MCLGLGQCQEFKNKYNTVRVKLLYFISRESDSRISNVRMSVFPSVCLSVRLSVCLTVCLSVCLSVRPSVRLSVCLSGGVGGSGD